MIPAQKTLLRAKMKEKRAHLFQENPEAGKQVATLFFENFDLPPQGIVGAYWPMGSELDIRPLLKSLMEKEVSCALPRITPQGLEFHIWMDAHPLIQGPFQILEPHPTDDSVVPDVLLIPLLAFDKRKHRLGYGQGHFDRYLHQYKVLTIGIGFKEQEIEEIPIQSHDFALDHILTEKGLIV